MKSVIDDLGAEVTGIASPVTVCMALTVLLVRVLNPAGESRSDVVAIASIYYNEKVRAALPGPDPAWEKRREGVPDVGRWSPGGRLGGDQVRGVPHQCPHLRRRRDRHDLRARPTLQVRGACGPAHRARTLCMVELAARLAACS